MRRTGHVPRQWPHPSYAAVRPARSVCEADAEAIADMATSQRKCLGDGVLLLHGFCRGGSPFPYSLRSVGVSPLVLMGSNS